MQSRTQFDEAWASLTGARGWLTRAQGLLLWEQASALPSGATALEIGSFEGRSTVALGTALRDRGGRLVAVDPFVEDWKFGDSGTRGRFEEHVRRAGLTDTVEVVADYSTAVRPGWTRRLDLLFIDGKHDVVTVRDDLRWASHLPDGAPVLVHDAFSSIGVTLALLLVVLPGHSLRYERREGSLALFRVGRPTAADRLRMAAELPWWVRNIGIKVLLRLRLRSVAAFVGHRSPYDPY